MYYCANNLSQVRVKWYQGSYLCKSVKYRLSLILHKLVSMHRTYEMPKNNIATAYLGAFHMSFRKRAQTDV
jgi:hypothetical protein